MLTNTALEDLIAPALAVLGLELLSCQFVSESGRKTLRVLIDAPKGITVDDCGHASQQINAILGAETSLADAYDLEVSSPGLDRPLITLAHYQRFIGSQVKITLRQPLEGRRHFTGQLLAASGEGVQIEVDGKTEVLMLENIEKANLTSR